jgi:3-oxoacyl-[acyl-carrier-protein] synthase III
MKVEQLFVSGVDAYFPQAVSVADAVADGRYDAKEVARTGLESVTVAGRESPPEMAIYAARGALTRARQQPAEISLFLHATTYHQGVDLYSTPSYILKALMGGDHDVAHGGSSTLALEVRGTSNGGMACLELAASYLAASPDRQVALITTADKLTPPVVDRWRLDSGMVMSDGAAAMLLSRRGGFARVLSVSSASDSSLEALHRGSDPFTPGPVPVSLFRRKRAFLAEFDVNEMRRRVRVGLRTAAERALHDAQTELSDIARFAVPHVSRVLLEEAYLEEFKITEAMTTWPLGRRIGHMCAGDQIVGLMLLTDQGLVKPGDRCLLMSVGAGFTWTCAVVEIIERLPRRSSPLFP